MSTAVIARELSLPEPGVGAVVRLLGDGCTVPFLARYRKEATGGLDEVAIRAIGERHAALVELGKRRETIRESLATGGHLTPELTRRLEACGTRTELEDLYLPYRPKRKTRASAARERGLEPLAARILAQPRDGDPRREAAAFVNDDVPDADAALAGARDIVAETMAERADLRAAAREVLTRHGRFASRAASKKIAAGPPTKFADWYDYSEPVTRVPSHRFLAIRRGEREKVLRAKIEVKDERLTGRLLHGMRRRPESPFADELTAAVMDGMNRLLLPAAERDVLAVLAERCDADAVRVFAENLTDLLLAAPLGERPVVGIDPGFRTGCKCAALSATGAFVGYETIFPFERARRDAAAAALVRLVTAHGAAAVAVGNGTASRETIAFAKGALAEAGRADVPVLSVSEAGASVYSASEIARAEFPDLDLTIRGAISIGRRLMDPLAELVKVDPKAIGVGQYQHDVPEALLTAKLDEVVETCVNRVGVELNTASAPLLARVAGLRPSVATAIVRHREDRGAYRRRRDLLEVPGLGPRAFEQAAGFLRIRGAANPLDASAVHPERYDLVARMAGDLGVGLADLVGDRELAARIEVHRYVGGDVGEPTLRDIVEELSRPGRDPREQFTAPTFREGVDSIGDVEEGMTFTGVVTNVTTFGAFVDIGVHQDGLVHVSELADRFVRDPREVVRAGQRLAVRVLSVDEERGRIGLTAKSPKNR